MSAKHTKIKAGLESMHKAMGVRAEINELYNQYRVLSSAASFSAKIEHFDFKRAVDALYYFGGGWPHKKSKGRMEAMLDNFVGMYRILDFIGEGDMVTKHLAKHGIVVTMDPKFAIKNVELTSNDLSFLNREYNTAAFGIEKPKDLRDMISQLIMTCKMLQRDICRLADTIKDDYRPMAQKELGVTDEEYDRLHEIVKFSKKGTDRSLTKARDKKIQVAESITNFNQALVCVSISSPLLTSTKPWDIYTSPP